MAFCKSCGQEIGTAVFCPKCGANQGAAPAPEGTATPSGASATEGISENVAGLLCYLVGWISGLVFLLIDKRPFVKFHAAQSVVVFGGLTVLRIVLGIVFGFGGGFAFGLISFVYGLLWLAGLVLWILLMVKAYQHEMFKLPVVAPLAESIAGK